MSLVVLPHGPAHDLFTMSLTPPRRLRQNLHHEPQSADRATLDHCCDGAAVFCLRKPSVIGRKYASDLPCIPSYRRPVKGVAWKEYAKARELPVSCQLIWIGQRKRAPR
ncbi:hypothetical protein BGZ61DRAFT_452571, partial [Ilyonectria robusta]|uniref:uncharacterized protein n=1 Tax=Ilyonectria robusta TaxID=1079257 RepID=UPI001E8D126D